MQEYLTTKNRIKELREDLGQRQIDVASATGIDQKTLSNYETGKTKPDSDALIRLANHFGVTVDYLIGFNPFNITDYDSIACELRSIREQLKSIERVLSSRPQKPF